MKTMDETQGFTMEKLLKIMGKILNSEKVQRQDLGDRVLYKSPNSDSPSGSENDAG